MKNHYDYRKWSAQGLDILRRYYGEMTVSELQAKYFPTRTLNSIWNKAYALGLGEKQCPKWTKDEIDILKKYYGTMEVEYLHNKYLPNRSTVAIIGKATKLGLTQISYNFKRYTKKEIDILKMWSGVISAQEIHNKY